MTKKAIRKEQVKGVHQATVERYWQIWATHVENDSTLIETAQTFGYKSISQVCRILKWCARQLQTDTPLETVQAQIWNKRKRLRLIRAKRAQCMDGNMHTETLGYLREERECENDIAKLEGAERQLISLEVTGKDGKAVTVEHGSELIERILAEVSRVRERDGGSEDTVEP